VLPLLLFAVETKERKRERWRGKKNKNKENKRIFLSYFQCYSSGENVCCALELLNGGAHPQRFDVWLCHERVLKGKDENETNVNCNAGEPGLGGQRLLPKETRVCLEQKECEMGNRPQAHEIYDEAPQERNPVRWLQPRSQLAK
jgi:hypothetical protein